MNNTQNSYYAKPQFFLTAVLGITFCAIVWNAWTCKDDIVGPVDITFPDTLVSYSRHVQPLFDQTCAIPTCHDASVIADGGVAFDSYAHATDRPLIIVRYDPDNSEIVRRIESTNPDYMMPRPPRFSRLTDNQIRGIRQWIKEGALPN